MSGMEFNTYHIRKEFSEAIKRAQINHQRNVQNRGITKQKKEELKKIEREVDRSRIEKTAKMREAMDDETKKIVERIDESNKKLPGLEERIQDIDREIGDINAMLNRVSRDNGKELMKRINELKAEKDRCQMELDAEAESLERNMRAFSDKVRSVCGEIEYNRLNLVNSMHETAKAILRRINRNVMFDPYCDYAYMEAALEVEAILEEEDADKFESTMDKLREVEMWLDEADEKVRKGIDSYVYIDGIKNNLERAFGNRSGCTFEWEGSPNSMLTIRITFRDCKSTIKMSPDGNGGMRSSVVNVTPGVNDKKAHDEICRRYCEKISEAAGLETDYDEQSLEESEIAKVQKEKRRTVEERAERSRKDLRERTRRAGRS